MGMAVAAACSGGGEKPAAESPAPAETVAGATATATVSATPSVADIPPGEAVGKAYALLREGRYGEARAAFEGLGAGGGSDAERAEAWLGAGMALHELGDAAGALAALKKAVALAPSGSSVAMRAAYLAAARLNDAGEYAEAGRVAGGAVAGGALGPYIAHERARALAGQGQGAEAGAVWDGILGEAGATGTLRAEVLRERARLARELGDDAGLARWLDALVAAGGGAEARYERAGVAKRRGETAAFAANLLAIVSEEPGSRFASLAIADLRDAGVAIDPGQEGLVYYRRGAYAEAKKVLEPALREAGLSGVQLAFRAYYLAAAYEDSGGEEEAVRYYDMAAGTGEASPLVHKARYWAARVSEGLGKAEDASKRYVQLALGGPTGEFSEEAAFRAGFVLLREGKTAAALVAWREVGAVASARLEYWRGRALELEGDGVAAREAYERAIAAGAYEFHGLEAAVRLGRREAIDAGYRERELDRAIDWDAIGTWLSGRVGGSRDTSGATAACDLVRVGMDSLAKDELLDAAEGAGAWRSLELAREATACGLPDVGARLAVAIREMAGVASHEAPADLLRVSYPVAFAAAVDEAARAADVDPLFLAALVRQESFWDARAGSTAGALGLTQVMPQTGAGIAAALGVREFEAGMLFRPAVALAFGGYYLGGQIGRFGDPLLALAAYNAGPGNALRWAERERGSAADLVESIDFLETRTYVTYIVEAYAHYELAWGR